MIEVFTVQVFTNKYSICATCERLDLSDVDNGLLNPAYLAEVADMMH